MAVSGVSPFAASNFQPSPQQNSFLQAFQQLANQLGSGTLAGAQQAYATLQQLQGNSPSQNDPNNPLNQTLNQIGQSLQSGDLGGALKALVSLLQQLEGNQGPGRHYGAGNAQGSNTNNNNINSNAPTNIGTSQSANSASFDITDSIEISINAGNNTSPTSTGTGTGQSANGASLTITETIGLSVNFTA